MFIVQSKSVTCAAALAVACWAVPAVAQDRSALVIANSAYSGDAALPALRKTALDVSETLLGLGFTVNRLENPSADAMQTALDTIANSTGPSLIYYAGRTEVVDDASLLLPVSGDAGIAIDPLLTGTSDAPRFVFVDMCHDAALPEGDAVAPLAETTAEAATAAENLFFAASVAPGADCVTGEQTLTDMLLDQITVPGLDANQITPPDDEAIWLSSSLADPFVFRTATSDVRLTAEDYAMLDKLSPNARDQMVRLWASSGIAVDIAGASAVAATPMSPIVSGGDTVVLLAPVRPIATATVISPIAPRNPSTVGIRPSGGVTLVAGGAPAPAPAVFRATPGENGLPAPSILVGYITEDGEIVNDAEILSPAIVDAPVAGAGLGYDDLEARNSMRSSNPELFASLVETGAFDPPDAEMAFAIQTELARMNCYKSTIDGLWGPGSRRSVAGYYEQTGGSTPSQDPVASIFRAIIVSEDVRCPDPAPRAVAQPARQTTSTPRRNTTTQAAPRAAAPAPVPAAPAAPARRTITQSTSTGAFR